MKQLAILIVAAVAMSLTADESQAQTGFSYGSFSGGRGFSISIGSGGFYDPGFGYGGWGYHPGYVPIYRPVPVIPVRPIYAVPYYGYGFGWGCGGW